MLIAHLEKEHKPHKESPPLEIPRSVMQINKHTRSYPRRKQHSLLLQKLPERMDFKGKWKSQADFGLL